MFVRGVSCSWSLVLVLEVRSTRRLEVDPKGDTRMIQGMKEEELESFVKESDSSVIIESYFSFAPQQSVLDVVYRA